MKLFLLLALCVGLTSCKSQQTSGSKIVERPIAFPGAEGFGKYTTGGREGKVFIVTNLNDNGAGSFRQAVENKIPAIIVFAVSGTINLESKLSIGSNKTIAGQTAPGDGICIADHPVSLSGNNIIIRYVRFRMGDKYQKGGMVDGNGSDDAFGGTRRENIIIDHCSLSWSTDEVFSVYAGDSTTLQWNIISEPLNYSYHFETVDKDYERHGYGAIWGGKHLSAHHNLFAHCNSRTPRFDGTRNSPSEFVDYVNNLIYNWGGNNVYAGEGGNYNIVNNYYKFGPETKSNVKYRVFNPFKRDPDIPFGKFYVDGNFVDGSSEVSKDNWLGVVMDKGTSTDALTSKQNNKIPAVEIAMVSPQVAYESILAKGGASLPKRDTLDERIINDVRNRTGRFIDVQGGYPHGTEYEKTVNAWPGLESKPAPVDSDHDGMPDEWETKNGLNPNNASDASSYKLDKKYTNIEMYLNSLQ
jgi:pectate lyase